MKNILMISYYFPPHGGPGVQRTLKFAKFLPDFDYNPIFLIPEPKFVRYIVHDHSLKHELPVGAKIYKTFIFDLNWLFKILYGIKLKSLVNFINGHLLFPEYQVQWLPFLKVKIRKVMRKEKIDALYITSPPHSIQKIVPWFKKNFEIPVVSDFRDPLTFHRKVNTHRLFARSFKLEGSILKSADHIIANTPLNKKNLIENFTISESKVSVITNGFDKEDFPVKPNKQTKDRKKIIFSHFGKLYGGYNAEPFLIALNMIKNDISNVEFRFVGKIADIDKKLIKEYKLQNLVKVIDYCSHVESINYIMESDYLLLILANPRSTYCIPGKTFEYLNSNIPIFAVVPEIGSCADVIEATKTGWVVSCNDHSAIAAKLSKIIEQHGELEFEPDRTVVDQFERRPLTEKLAEILNQLLHDRRREKD